MQLEPVIVCPEVKEILVQSLFQRLWYTDIPKWQLQLQYRLPESVIPFFNENVYNSDHGLQPIMVDPTRKELPLPTGLLIKNPIVLVDSSSIGRKRGEGEETQIINRGFYNSTEAATIVDMVEQLVRCIPGTIATDIGISAPYKMQIGQIQDMIRARQWPTGFKLDQLVIDCDCRCVPGFGAKIHVCVHSTNVISWIKVCGKFETCQCNIVSR